MDEQSRTDLVARIPELGALDASTLDRVLRVLRPFDAGGLEISGMERLNTLLEVPHPERFIPALPTQELYFFLQDVGASDCTELVRYASAEQLGGFVDLGAWERDRFSVDRFHDWFRLAGESSPAQIDKLLAAVDPELLVLVLQRSARVYDVREAPEDVPEGEVMFPSPDGAFRLIMADDDDKLGLIQKVLSHLYAKDLEEGRRLLQACRWELPSPLEESCYQWRIGRAGDMGFLSVDEAAEIEQPIDIAALEEALSAGHLSVPDPVAAESPHPFAGWFLARRGGGLLLAELLAGMADRDQRDRVLQGLVYLLNRRLSFRGLDLGEWGLVRQETDHVWRMTSLGVERLLPAAGGEAASLFDRLPLVALYRTGATLLRALSQRAAALQRRAALRPGQNPFDPPADFWLEGLRAVPPRRYTEPEAKAKSDLFAPFASLSEVDRARDVLDGAEAVLHLFEERWGWGEDRLAAPDLAGLDDGQQTELRFSSLLTTGLANQLLGRSADFRPLDAEALDELRRLVFVPADPGRRIDPVVRTQVLQQVKGLAPQGGAQEEALRRFVAQALDNLEDSLGGLSEDERPDPRFLGGVLLTR